jgi:hypothetical protein
MFAATRGAVISDRIIRLSGMEDVTMCIKRPYWLLLGMLICLGGCSPTRMPAPDTQRPPGPIPTPSDAPAEPTFTPDVPPHLPSQFLPDDRPLPPVRR